MTLATTLAVALLAAAPEDSRQGAPAAAAPPGAAEGMPEALRKAFEREIPPLAQVTFKITREAGALEAKVEAKGKVEVGRDGEVDTLVIPLGTEQAVQCFVSRSRMDGASPVAMMLERMKKGVQVVSVRLVEVAAVAQSPALFAEAVYLADGQEGRKNAGHLKQAVVAHPDRSLMCMHDEPGYADAFRRLVKGLATSLSLAAPDARSKARFAEVVAVRMAGVPVGFVEQTIVAGEDGASTLHHYFSLVVPRSPSDIVAEDKAFVQQLDASGHVVSSWYSKGTAGEIETEMTLERSEDGKTYAYRGTRGGKKLEGTFTTRDGLASDLLVAGRMPKLLSGASKEERFQEYSVAANPVNAIETVYRKDSGARRVTVETGGMKVKVGLDAYGWPTAMEIPIGPATMTYERIWSRGRP